MTHNSQKGKAYKTESDQLCSLSAPWARGSVEENTSYIFGKRSANGTPLFILRE